MNIKKIYTDQIKLRALNIGFTACGVTKATHLEKDAFHLKKWLTNKMHAEMHYMGSNFEKRTDPRKLVENAKSVISVILNYYPKNIQIEDTFKISKYAYGEDYHFVMKNMLKELADIINRDIIDIKGRAFVDSAPVLDRSNARYAGLGWIGKNTNLINKEYGSFIFIGELVVDVELEYDDEVNTYCGNCTRCIDACPTNAIIEPYVVDSEKCISYLTIEKKGELSDLDSKTFNDWIFGCDICQDVCPWNAKVKPHTTEEFNPKTRLLEMTKADWKTLDKEQFDSLFSNSAIKRTKYEGLRRNIKFVSNED